MNLNGAPVNGYIILPKVGSISVLLLPDLSTVLRLTATLIGIFPLLSTTPMTFSLPLESTKDCCFVILIELLIVVSAATACAFANEGNCSRRTESVRIVTNPAVKVNTKDLIIILYHL